MNLLIEKIKNKSNKNKLVELFKYGIIGVCTTTLNIFIYKFLTNNFNIYYLYSNFYSWIIALIFSFFSNKHFIFNKSYNNSFLKEFFLFFLSRVFTGILDMFLMFISVDILQIDGSNSKLVINILIIVLNYLTVKFLVFKK